MSPQQTISRLECPVTTSLETSLQCGKALWSLVGIETVLKFSHSSPGSTVSSCLCLAERQETSSLEKKDVPSLTSSKIFPGTFSGFGYLLLLGFFFHFCVCVCVLFQSQQSTAPTGFLKAESSPEKMKKSFYKFITLATSVILHWVPIKSKGMSQKLSWPWENSTQIKINFKEHK